MSQNIIPFEKRMSRRKREMLIGHKPAILWFTGLSGSGKSTISHAVEEALLELGNIAYVLDGDNVRRGMNRDLGFSHKDREENIRRIGEISKLFVDAGIIVLPAFISPYRTQRHSVRNLVEPGEFIEVYVKCPLEVCENRDPKGLYKKARTGEIENFTGVSAPYEEPENPEILVDTSVMSIGDSVEAIIHYLHVKGYLCTEQGII